MSIIVDNILYTSSFIPKQIQKNEAQHDDILKKYAETKGCINIQPITNLKSICGYSVIDEIELNRFLLDDGRIVGPLAFNKKCLNENKPFTVYIYNNRMVWIYDYTQHKNRSIYEVFTPEEMKILHNDPHTNPLIKPHLPSVRKCLNRSRTYKVNGVEYKSLKELSKAYGINQTTLRYQSSKGRNLEEYINKCINKETPYSRTYIVNGVEYKSIHSLGKAYRINPSTLRYHFLQGQNLEEYINEHINEENLRSRTYKVNGVEYKSIYSLGKVYGIKSSTLRNHFLQGENLEEYINKHINKEVPCSRTYIVNGVEYKSFNALSRAYGISATSLQRSFSKGENLEEYINKRVNKETPHSRTYTVNGVEYKSFKALGDAYGINSQSLSQHFSKGENLEEYINKRVNNETPYSRTYTVNGVEYKSLKALEDIYGIHQSTLYGALRRGKNLEEYINKRINK